MPKRITGRYERTKMGGEEVAAFIPHGLPPADPPIVLDTALAERIRGAEQALVRLELAGEMVPSLDVGRSRDISYLSESAIGRLLQRRIPRGMFQG